MADVIVTGLTHLHAFNARTGEGGLARWLRYLLRQRLSLSRREARHATLEDADAERWSLLYCQSQRERLVDVALCAEARQRLRMASLTHLQRECLEKRLAGWRFKRIAHTMGLSVEAVETHVYVAVEKLREVRLDVLETDWPHSEVFAIGAEVSVYFAPQKLGSLLDQEKLAAMTREDALRYARALRRHYLKERHRR